MGESSGREGERIVKTKKEKLEEDCFGIKFGEGILRHFLFFLGANALWEIDILIDILNSIATF